MPWNVLLFPLIGGYLFVNRSHLFKYRIRRCEGERLLLECALYGTLCLLLARLLIVGSHHLVIQGFNVGDGMQSALHGYIAMQDAPYLGTGLASLVLGFAGAAVFNGVFNRLAVKGFVLDRYGDDALMREIHASISIGYPLSITLSSRKVYIGWVLEPPGDSLHDRYFKLLLLRSGYRTEDTLEFIPSVNYADRTTIDADGKEENVGFTIMLNTDDLISLNPFDQALFDSQFANKMVQSSNS